jgi:DNA-directed RNA polymerase specialized sigma24 family protein
MMALFTLALQTRAKNGGVKKRYELILTRINGMFPANSTTGTITDDLTPFERPGATTISGIGMDLEKAIASLPDQARKVFVLYQVEGYKHADIANMLGIAPDLYRG